MASTAADDPAPDAGETPGGKRAARGAGDADVVSREQVNALLARARDNEQTHQRLREMELRLIGAETLLDLIGLLVFEYRELFRLDAVSLLLVDPEYEFQRALEAADIPLKLRQQLLFVSGRDEVAEVQALGARGRLGPYVADQHAWLFAEPPDFSASLALLPLVRGNTAVGLLSFASYDLERFLPGQATDFLEHLAAIATMCLLNHLHQQRARLRSLTDTITGVNNRGFFDQRLREEIARAQRQKEPVTCLFVDIDAFHALNQQFGHKAGDTLLHHVADLLAARARYCDVLARYQGEQFVLIMSGTNVRDGTAAAERIRRSISENTFELDAQRRARVTASIGIATAYPEGVTADARHQGGELVDCAFRAMRLAKKRGRNRCVSAGVVERERSKT